MGLFQLFLVLHIVAGFVALAVFAVPIVTRKGGKVHVYIGWIYVWAMGTVAVSAWFIFCEWENPSMDRWG